MRVLCASRNKWSANESPYTPVVCFHSLTKKTNHQTCLDRERAKMRATIVSCAVAAILAFSTFNLVFKPIRPYDVVFEEKIPKNKTVSDDFKQAKVVLRPNRPNRLSYHRIHAET